MSVNSVSLTGNLTRDPELKATQGGLAILSFGIAVNERVKQGDGSWGDRANFFDVTVFGARGEGLAKFLTKGMKVAVHGRLHYSSWEKDGQRHSRVSVIADEVDVMQRRQDGGQAQYQPSPAAAPVASVPPAQQPQQAAIAYDVTQTDTDIPF